MFPEPDGKREVGRGKSGVGVRTTVSFTHPPALLYASTSPREKLCVPTRASKTMVMWTAFE